MPRIKYIRHLKIRSEKLRAIMHDMWLLGNDSIAYPNEPDGIEERRKAITDRLVKEGFASIEEVPETKV